MLPHVGGGRVTGNAKSGLKARMRAVETVPGTFSVAAFTPGSTDRLWFVFSGSCQVCRVYAAPAGRRSPVNRADKLRETLIPDRAGLSVDVLGGASYPAPIFAKNSTSCSTLGGSLTGIGSFSELAHPGWRCACPGLSYGTAPRFPEGGSYRPALGAGVDASAAWPTADTAAGSTDIIAIWRRSRCSSHTIARTARRSM